MIKERILEASEELFLKYGVKSITMDEIAKHLSISKKTIYQYYQDKDEIVFLFAKRILERDQEVMCAFFANSASAVDEMMRASDHMRSTLANVHTSLLFDLQKYHPQAWKLVLNHKKHFVLERLQDNLKRGIAEGLYRPEIRPDILARLRLEQVQLAFDAQIFPLDTYNFLEVQLHLLDHFLRGVVTEKGLQVLEQYATTVAALATKK